MLHLHRLRALCRLPSGLGDYLRSLSFEAVPARDTEVQLQHCTPWVVEPPAPARHIRPGPPVEAVLAAIVLALEVTHQSLGLLQLLGGCTAAYVISIAIERTRRNATRDANRKLVGTPRLLYIVSRYIPMPHRPDIDAPQYQALADLRYQIRRFLTFSEAAARAADVEPQQHQLLLVLKALRPHERPTIAIVAERLQIQHNSAVELVKRSVQRGLVERRTSTEDRREASLHITRAGERLLRRLSLAHQTELRSAAPALLMALEALVGTAGSTRAKRPRSGGRP